MFEEIPKEELQYVALLLKNKDLAEDYEESPLDKEYFDSSTRMIIHAISDATHKDVLLTRKSFIEFIKNFVGNNKELAKLEATYNHISYMPVNRNDYPMLKEKIVNTHLLRSTSQFVKNFAKNREEKTVSYAVGQLANDMSGLVEDLSHNKSKVVYDNFLTLGKNHFQHILDVRAGSVPDVEFISYGINELDKTSQVGLSTGTLTLFCGDVGSGKSTMMLNVAAHAWWKDNRNVLFIPLEMPEKMVHHKLWSRQSGVPFDYIMSPKALNEEQLSKLKKTKEEWEKHEAKMFFMDSYEERTKVSLIRKMIERNLEIFQPRIVVVDYIANLQPDKNQNGRNDLEIGDMLKDLRYMGRAGVIHKEGFAIISGAQIGREALKRVRRSASDKTMFYSEDIRGSHEYSADADMMYAQFMDPQQDDRLQLFCVKARYGKKTFPDGSFKAALEFKPEICLIRSSSDYYAGTDKNEVLKKVSVDDDDMDFSTTAKKEKIETEAEEFFGNDKKEEKDIFDM